MKVESVSADGGVCPSHIVIMGKNDDIYFQWAFAIATIATIHAKIKIHSQGHILQGLPLTPSQRLSEKGNDSYK